MQTKAKRKGVKRASGAGRKILRTVLIVILCAAIIGGGVYLTWRLTDGFTNWGGSENHPGDDGITHGTIVGECYVETGGAKYGDGGVTVLASGSTFHVGAGFGANYSVTMTANGAHDFAFTLGAEPYRWSNVRGDDFTAGFDISRAADSFTVSYGTIADIISAVKGNAVTITDAEVTVSDKFTMTVSGNGNSIDVNFIVSVTGVTVDPDGIVFGGDGGSQDSGEQGGSDGQQGGSGDASQEPVHDCVSGFMVVSTSSYESYFDYSGKIERVNVQFDYTDVPSLSIYGSGSGMEPLLRAGKSYEISVENNGGDFWTDNLGWTAVDKYEYNSAKVTFSQGSVYYTPEFDVYAMDVQLMRYPLDGNRLGTINFYISIKEA